MSTSITIEEAQAKLAEIIGKLSPGDGVVITQGSRPVAELRTVPKQKPQPQFGNCRGMLAILADDDEHLDDFADYMP